MNILVLGGTRYFGVHMVNKLLVEGHEVTIATRGITPDSFGNKVKRVIVDRLNRESMKNVFQGKYYDIVYDKLAYCSDDVANTLDFISCGKYVLMSSSAVYDDKSLGIKESDFEPADKAFVMCKRGDLSYGETKQEAERILVQKYKDIKYDIVRYPVVLGVDDYTNRLRFYVEHIVNQVPMYIDNLDEEICYIGAKEAGKFLAYLADDKSMRIINGCSSGTISLATIIDYVEEKCGKKAILSADGESAPFNGEVTFSLDTSISKELGYEFSDLRDWIYELLDVYMETMKR